MGGARAGESLVENYVTGQTSMPEAPIALMRLLLLPSWYRPGQPFDGFYNGWLLNELILGFDDYARLVKRRVNQGAIGSIPPDLRVALLAGLSSVAASPPASLTTCAQPADQYTGGTLRHSRPSLSGSSRLRLTSNLRKWAGHLSHY